MGTTRIIPDAYTEYEDGHIGAVAPSLANIEAKIGGAKGGTPNQLYVLSGPDAKSMAKQIFKGGPLLRSIEEAFDAGSSTIYAWRVGPCWKASLDLQNEGGGTGIRLTALEAGEYHNNVQVTVDDELANVVPGYWYLDSDGNRLVHLDQNGDELGQVDLTSHFATARGCCIHFADPDDPNFMSVWVAGTDSVDHEILRHFSTDGTLIPEDNVDLSLVVSGEQVTAMIFAISEGDGPRLVFSTPTQLFILYEIVAQPELPVQTIDYTSLGIVSPDINGGCLGFQMEGGEPQPSAIWILDKTARAIYEIGPFGPEGGPTAVMRTVDLSGIDGSDQASGLSTNFWNGNTLLATPNTPSGWRMIEFPSYLDAPGEGDISNSFDFDHALSGLTFTAEEMYFNTVVEIWDGNEDDPQHHVFVGSTNDILVSVISSGQDLVEAEFVEEGTLDTFDDPQSLSGGDDGLYPSNGDYLHALDLSENKPEISWVHCVGATGEDMWNAILVHCDQMLDVHLSERFAVLECPEFSSTNEEGSTAYITDLQNYVDSIVLRMQTVGNRNGVVFAGGAKFMDSDGEKYVAGSLTSACSGVMASLEVQQSLINKQVPNILKLVPEFSPGHVQQLIQARVNCVRLKPGRGYIIAHSLTAAASGSDYSRANDLRAVYYGGKAAREAAQPLVGEENDEEGNGLRLLESFMSRPLDVMEDHGQIDDYEIEAVSSDNDRLLGDVYVSLGIQPLRAMEKIYTKVFLK